MTCKDCWVEAFTTLGDVFEMQNLINSWCTENNCEPISVSVSEMSQLGEVRALVVVRSTE